MNTLFYGDNLLVLRDFVQSDSVDLVYLDPPFNSNRSYNVIFSRSEASDQSAQIQAFDDTWRWSPTIEQAYFQGINGEFPGKVSDAMVAFRTLLGESDAMAYLVSMAPRLVELQRVMRDGAQLYLHCDPTMGHYLKVLLDTIFGLDGFLNEIIWHYETSGGAPKQTLIRNHDLIFRYVKGDRRLLTWNHPRQPWPETTLAKWQRDEDGNYYRFNRVTGKRYYADPEGKLMDDVWHLTFSSRSKERLGYPTQKPLALLNRIIQASSNEGDLVLDPFCGCGTTVDAAQRLLRRWIGIDITYIAVDLIAKRLEHTYGPDIVSKFTIAGIPRDVAAAQALFDVSAFDFERWAVSLVRGTPNAKKGGDGGIDGVIRFNTGPKELGKALVSVKGGRQLNPGMVRDLVGTVEGHKAQMGVLVTLHAPTRGMVEAANKAGYYTFPANNETYPRIQIITIEQLLNGSKLRMPLEALPYIPASALTREESVEQMGLAL